MQIVTEQRKLIQQMEAVEKVVESQNIIVVERTEKKDESLIGSENATMEEEACFADEKVDEGDKGEKVAVLEDVEKLMGGNDDLD